MISHVVSLTHSELPSEDLLTFSHWSSEQRRRRRSWPLQSRRGKQQQIQRSSDSEPVLCHHAASLSTHHRLNTVQVSTTTRQTIQSTSHQQTTSHISGDTNDTLFKHIITS